MKKFTYDEVLFLLQLECTRLRNLESLSEGRPDVNEQRATCREIGAQVATNFRKFQTADGIAESELEAINQQRIQFRVALDTLEDSLNSQPA